MLRRLSVLLAVMLALFLVQSAYAQSPRDPRVIANELAGPWEVTWGPDGYLWITERIGKRVTRVHPDTGQKSVALALPEVSQEQKDAGQPLLAGVEELIDQIGLDPRIPCQQKSHEDISERLFLMQLPDHLLHLDPHQG